MNLPSYSTSPFNVDKEKLRQLVKSKNQDILRELGGVDGTASSLKTHASNGIRGDAADLRRRIKFSESKSYGIRRAVIEYVLAMPGIFFKDRTLVFLFVCSLYLVIVGIVLDGSGYGWEDGVFILVFSVIFSEIGAATGKGVGAYFSRAVKGSQLVIVWRNGVKQQIPVSSILVGDIVLLRPGDKIPADGLLLEKYGKQSLKLDDDGDISEISCSDPFLKAEAKVVDGLAKMMVTSRVERKSSDCNYKNTNLVIQTHGRVLEVMKWALALSSLVISLTRYFTGIEKDDNGYRLFNPGMTSALEVSYRIVRYATAASAIFVAMDTSNLSLGLMVSFAHAINVMASDNVIVRSLSSWERIVFSVTTVNVMEEFNASNQLISSSFRFVPKLTENREASSKISPNILQLIQQGIGLNTTGISNHAQRKCKLRFAGSQWEMAFLSQAALETDMDWKKLMNECAIIQVESLEDQGRGILVKKDESFLRHIRGPAEMILARCSGYYDDMGSLSSLDVHTRSSLEQTLQLMKTDSSIQVIGLAYRQVPDHTEGNDDWFNMLGFVVLKEVNQDESLQIVVQKCPTVGMELNNFHEEILGNGAADAEPEEMGTNQGLESQTSPPGMTTEEDHNPDYGGDNGSEKTTGNCSESTTSQKDLHLLEQDGVFQEVEQDRQKEDLDTGDNAHVSTDGTLAQGTLADEEDTIKSEEESNESREDAERSKEVVSNSQSDDVVVAEQIHDASVLATVENKVTDTSNVTNATVSISMGIEGDEATRTSDIVILDGKYTTLPLIERCAERTLLNTKTFTQFQLTVMFTSIANALISFAEPTKTSEVDSTLLYQLVQQVWANTAMGFIAALTFGRQQLHEPPEEEKKLQVIERNMWRNIVTQSVYQITVVSVLKFKGWTIGFSQSEVDTTTFVVPIFLQVVNMIGARKIKEKNIFSGIRLPFICLVVMLMIVPFVLVEILTRIVNLERLGVKQWAICIGIALVSWPVGFAAKFVPSNFFATVFHKPKELGKWIKSSASKLAFM